MSDKLIVTVVWQVDTLVTRFFSYRAPDVDKIRDKLELTPENGWRLSAV
jgi:hypothetical protein